MFLRRSLCAGLLGAAPRVERLAPGAKAVGCRAEVLAGVIESTVCVCDPAARLFHRRVPGGRERDDLQRRLAVARVAVRALTSIELIRIAVAGAGVIGWILADQRIVATACVVAADLIGAAMMVPKTHRDPESETLVTFALAGLGGALAAGAVGATEPTAHACG